MSECFATYGITQPIRKLAYIVLGYNISNPEYVFVNLIFSILGFSIYNSYFLSDNRRDYCDVLRVFKNEFHLLFLFYGTRNASDNCLNIFAKKLVGSS